MFFCQYWNADVDEFQCLIKLFTGPAFIIIIIIIIIIGIIVLKMRHYKLSHGVYDQEICGRLPVISKKVQVLVLKRPECETEHLRPYNTEGKNT